MLRTLCLDFGNTRLKAALFIEDQLEEIIVIPDESADTIKNLLDQLSLNQSQLHWLQADVLRPQIQS
jgi:type III pantothenate kinase